MGSLRDDPTFALHNAIQASHPPEQNVQHVFVFVIESKKGQKRLSDKQFTIPKVLGGFAVSYVAFQVRRLINSVNLARRRSQYKRRLSEFDRRH